MQNKVSFFKGWSSTPDPTLPKESINGDVPLRAYQYCEPFLAANRIGWLLYPPINFDLVWDGSDTLISFGEDEWIIVDRLFLPDQAVEWKKFWPENLHHLMPVFIESFKERGVLQVWTGLYAETEPGFGLWIRSMINQPRSDVFDVIEGVVDTDWWGGPIFTNFQMVKTNKPVSFRTEDPFLQVLVAQKDMYGSRKKDACISVRDHNDGLPKRFVDKMVETNNRRNSEAAGSYKRLSRKGK